MTNVVIIRHGETQSNRDGRIQGHSQTLLNAIGEEQAGRVAARMQRENFQALYSSDLLRARHTADAIARLSGHEVVGDPGLREWDLGVLAGLSRAEAERRYPDAFAIYRDSLVDQLVPGGESIRRRYLRVISTIEGLAARHPGQLIVIVTHGGPLGDCYRHATGMPLEAAKDFQLYNAGVNRFVIEEGDWRLRDWGDIDHLQGIDTLGNWVGSG